MGYKSKRKKLYAIVFFSIVIVAVAITLFVVFLMPKNKVITFENCDVAPINQEVEPVKLKQGAIIEELPELVVYGYVFHGWYYSEEFTEENKVKLGEDRLIEDISLYPFVEIGTFTVSFDINGATGNTPEPVTAIFGTEFNFPIASLVGIYMISPEYGEMDLRYWALTPTGDGNATKQGETGTVPGENVTYYAFWHRKTTLIKYFPNGGQFVAQNEYFAGEPLPPEAVASPTGRTGYAFEDWFFNEECTDGPINIATFDPQPGVLNLYAKWNPIPITVKFYLDATQYRNGNVLTTQLNHYDGLVTKPADPTKEGFYFKYWAIGSPTIYSEFNFNTKLKSPVELFGVWSTEIIIEDETSKENFDYDVTADNKIIINGLTTEGKTLTSIKVPRQIDLLDVVYIDGIKDNVNLTSVGLPHTLETLGAEAFVNCPNITKFYFTSDNPNYVTIDDVIYNKNKTTLIRYPAAKAGTSYETQFSTETIGSNAFHSAKFLTDVVINAKTLDNLAFFNANSIKNITINASVQTIKDDALQQCNNIESITVSNNSNFEVENGILYQLKQGVKDRVLKCFNKEENANIVIDNNVTGIASFAFQKCNNITRLEFGENVVNFGKYCMYEMSGLTEIKFNNGATSGIIFGPVWIGVVENLTTVYAHENSAIWVQLSSTDDGDKLVAI